jgi:hypothetical protein
MTKLLRFLLPWFHWETFRKHSGPTPQGCKGSHPSLPHPERLRHVPETARTPEHYVNVEMFVKMRGVRQS